MAREFLADDNRRIPGDVCVAVFAWGDIRRVRRPEGGWEELGPGLDLCVASRGDIPPAVIHSIDGVDLAIQIPSHIYNASTQRFIDTDEAVRSKVILR